jgi:hypothetical protein
MPLCSSASAASNTGADAGPGMPEAGVGVAHFVFGWLVSTIFGISSACSKRTCLRPFSDMTVTDVALGTDRV